jgi:LPPG:FO 2-phospho-L-lactate transferase
MKITALAGGVGGAKFAHGLSRILEPEDLTVIVNTGDDFVHLGLYICPDLDTVCYTLGDMANPVTGWGRAEETWNSITSLEDLGGPGWFRLGDKDLGTHLERTRRLHENTPLSTITRDFCSRWGIKHTILPMSDSPVRTIVETEEGPLPFQHYFVQRQCAPRVNGFRFEGINSARPAPGVSEALDAADVVILCPSNPWVSIDPILNLIGKITKPVFAISPIIGGRAVKGPAAKMFAEMGMEPSALAVARHYQDLLRGFVIDNTDQMLADQIRIKTLVTDTIMNNVADRTRLAEDVLHFIGSL